MRLTSQEFIEQFRYKLAGLALFGAASELKDNPLGRTQWIFNVPAEVEKLLAEMYQSLSQILPAVQPVKPAANGQPAPQTQVRR